jgi:elongation factor 2 kinase
MQNKASDLAEAYNKALVSKCRPTDKIKKVRMLEALILEHKGKVMGLEEYIEGDFRRYGNNFDFFDFGRNTPNAFSCFTLFFTGGKMVVVDVQGVGDTYTDPQIHCNEGLWGAGNFREKGIAKFRASHKHNNLCLALGMCKPHEVHSNAGTRI